MTRRRYELTDHEWSTPLLPNKPRGARSAKDRRHRCASLPWWRMDHRADDTEWRRAGCAPELGAWSWSLGWGAIGKAVGIQTTLLIGAAGLLVAGFIMHRIKLPAGDADMVPSNHWPEPLVAEPFCP